MQSNQLVLTVSGPSQQAASNAGRDSPLGRLARSTVRCRALKVVRRRCSHCPFRLGRWEPTLVGAKLSIKALSELVEFAA